MRQFILVFVGLITSVYTRNGLETCFDAVSQRVSGCCEMDISDSKKAISRECREKFPDNNKCDFEICYAEKKGFLFPNRTVNQNEFEYFLETDLAKYPNILSIIKQKCLNVDISEFGQPETCYLKKIGNCMSFFVLANCPKWSNEQRCLKFKSASEECAKVLT